MKGTKSSLSSLTADTRLQLSIMALTAAGASVAKPITSDLVSAKNDSMHGGICWDDLGLLISRSGMLSTLETN